MAVREDDHIVANTTKARAGVTGRNARVVLALSALGIAVPFAILYLYFFAA